MTRITAIRLTVGGLMDSLGRRPKGQDPLGMRPMNATIANHKIPEFTDAEQKLVSATLFERYGKWFHFNRRTANCSLMHLLMN